jgi:hypothetical protein
MSMPITAMVVLMLAMGVLLVFGAPPQRQRLAGQEHGRTIPVNEPARAGGRGVEAGA